MSFDVQIVHSVQKVGQEAWDHLSGDQPFATYRWYRFGETVLSGDVPVYIILYHENEPLARATFWLRRQEPLPITSRPLRFLVQSILRRWPLLMCKAPLADASGLILPPPPLRDPALETIAQAARERARQYHVSFVGAVYLEPEQARFPGWPKPFAAVELPEPGTRLEITWPDFESYLQHLSKSAYKDYRRHRNRAADLDIEVKCHPKVNNLDRAMALIRNVEQHHDSPPNPWAEAMLKNGPMVDATWLTAQIEERVVGCGLLLGDGDNLFMTLLGRDYDVQYAYFQLVYRAIRHVIEQGAQVLWGGTGAYRMKQRLGFRRTSDNYATFAGNGPLLQRLGRWIAGTEEQKVADSWRLESR